MHFYPNNLAAELTRLWDQPLPIEPPFGPPVDFVADPLPPSAVLEDLLSTCYQASLLREENRSVRLRLILIAPERLMQESELTPAQLQPLPFDQDVPYTPEQLRRLAPAADFERTLIGVQLKRGRRLVIWGLIHSGARWIRALEGSRESWLPLPPALVIGVPAPGHLAVCKGSWLVARLRSGDLSTPAPGFLNVEDSLTQTEGHRKLLTLHARARREANSPWAQLDPKFVRFLRRCTSLRIISAMRKLQHGGTLLFLPPRLIRQDKLLAAHLRIKYPFSNSASRQSYYLHLLRLLNALAESCGRLHGPDHVVGWTDYVASSDPTVTAADAALNELAWLIADASAVDGAVVLGVPAELVGFGAEISSALPPVEQVACALNAEGSKVRLESTNEVGTRHRSVYRLCQALPRTVAVVVSQDGGVRLVRKRQRRVTYWIQQPFGTAMV